MSISNYLEGKILNKVFKATDFTSPTVYAQLHGGDPGDDGTSNVLAGYTTRSSAISFGTVSGGSVASSADITWTSITPSGSGLISHVSLWDASTSGNCLWTGALTPNRTVSSGDNLTIPSGSLIISLD
jgi:hypothetical protein